MHTKIPLNPAKGRFHTLALAALAGLSFLVLLVITERPVSTLLRNTLVLSISSALLATPIGAGLSFLLLRGAPWRRNLAGAILAMLLFVPLQLQLAGWDALFGKLGWQTLAYGSPEEPFLHGMRGAIWVHAMAAIPWTTLLCGLGWLAVEPQWEEAAILEMSPARVACRITLPQAIPFIFTAALWVLIQAAGEMTVTNIYVVRTYAEELYNEIAADGGGAGLASTLFPGMLGAFGILFISMAIASQLGMAASAFGRRSRSPLIPRRNRPFASIAVWTIILALVGVPVSSLIVRSGMTVATTAAGPERVWSAISAARVIMSTPLQFQDEFLWTLLISVTTATLAVLVAVHPAWRWRSARSAWAWGLFVVALGLPGPIVGLALIWLFNRPEVPGLLYLYDDTIAAPVLAMLVRAVPLTLLVLMHGFSTVGTRRLEAAALDGAGPMTRFWRIALPQRVAVVGVAWLVAFAHAAGDLSCSILVLPPGITTLQFRLFEKVHSGVEEQVAGIALVSAASYAGLTFAAVGLYQYFVKPAQIARKPL